MKELTDKASVSEVGAHLPVAQQILSSPEGQQVIAFLLKSYYAQAANEGERRAHQDAPAPGPGRQRGPRPEAANGDAASAGSAAGGAAEGDGEGRRRRRRRRGRRGERGDRPERNDRGGERSIGEGFETMDAHEALGRGANDAPARTPAPAAPVESAAPVAAEVAAPAAQPAVAAPAPEPVSDGFTRLRVNIGFDDGFKGRGAVAKRVAALAGLTEGSVLEVESRREFSVLKAAPDIAELVVDRVDGTPIGKKVLTVQIA